jgi:cytochrome c peroxidase
MSAVVLTDTDSFSEKVDSIFEKQLDETIRQVAGLKMSVKQEKRLLPLQKKFLLARLSFKKTSIVIDHFYPFEARQLNGPALPRTEEDNPEQIYAPHGFQVIEELLFKSNNPSFASLEEELDVLLTVLVKFKNETGRAQKFNKENVLDALRASVIRLICLGITGFDSPLAKNSIPEAQATLGGMKVYLQLYKKKDGGSWMDVQALLDRAIQYVSVSTTFDNFDRLSFIRNLGDPLYSRLARISSEAGYNLENGKTPVNYKARSLFAPDFFDTRFFSPNERFVLTAARADLGKRLFYDPLLSGNSSRSCATCHKPQLAFTDGLKTAVSFDEKTNLTRNTPTLWNSVFQTKQFYDSRTSKLENQLSEVVHNTNEMQGSLQESIQKIRLDKEYRILFTKAYSNEADAVTEYTIANAVSSYVRSLVALNSRFDQFMRGREGRLSVDERAGFNLFAGKAKCATCHFIPLFNGLVPPDFSETESEVLGVPGSKDTLHAILDEDEGKYLYTRSDLHRYAFKTPTLRNIELTSPYMHNGVYNSLEEVLEFYNKGGGNGLHIAPANITLPDEKLRLTKKELYQLNAFLKTLTDTTQQKNR